MNKVCSILLIILGAIGFFASIFSAHSYYADFSDDVVSLISWILRIISLAILIVGASFLADNNKRNNPVVFTNTYPQGVPGAAPRPVPGTATRESVMASSGPGNLRKGDTISIKGFGLCRYEGMWEGKYAFYPEQTTNLPESPYLVNDVEPYLLIPAEKLRPLDAR